MCFKTNKDVIKNNNELSFEHVCECCGKVFELRVLIFGEVMCDDCLMDVWEARI